MGDNAKPGESSWRLPITEKIWVEEIQKKWRKREKEKVRESFRKVRMMERERKRERLCERVRDREWEKEWKRETVTERKRMRQWERERQTERDRRTEREREWDSERISPAKNITWLFGMLTFSQMISLGLGAWLISIASWESNICCEVIIKEKKRERY